MPVAEACRATGSIQSAAARWLTNPQFILDSHMRQFDSNRPSGCDTEGESGKRGTGLLEMVEVCSLCDGSGLRIVQEGGRQVAKACDCRLQRRVARMLERARIPKRYEHCTLDNYEAGYRGADKSLKSARLVAQRFVEGYPIETDGKGLLLTGDIGVGKTHLAVGILKELIVKRGVLGLFYDYRELLKEVQNTYNREVAATELGILKPVFEAEVLVLDELGAAKPTDWVWDT